MPPGKENVNLFERWVVLLLSEICLQFDKKVIYQKSKVHGQFKTNAAERELLAFDGWINSKVDIFPRYWKEITKTLHL